MHLQGDMHTHTIASTHAYSTITENCQWAEKYGMWYALKAARCRQHYIQALRQDQAAFVYSYISVKRPCEGFSFHRFKYRGLVFSQEHIPLSFPNHCS